MSPPDKIQGTLGTKLLAVVAHYIRNEPKPWGQLNSQEQQDTLEGLQEQIDDILKVGVVDMLSGALPRVPGQLKSVIAKDGVRAVVDVASDTQSLHDLVDRVGSSVVIVLVGPEEYQVEIDKFVILVQPDQPDLPGIDLDKAAGLVGDPPGFRGDQLCLCGHLGSSHSEQEGCSECVCEVFELAPVDAEFAEVCDRDHDPPACDDPNCWLALIVKPAPASTAAPEDDEDD